MKKHESLPIISNALALNFANLGRYKHGTVQKCAKWLISFCTLQFFFKAHTSSNWWFFVAVKYNLRPRNELLEKGQNHLLSNFVKNNFDNLSISIDNTKTNFVLTQSKYLDLANLFFRKLVNRWFCSKSHPLFRH